MLYGRAHPSLQRQTTGGNEGTCRPADGTGVGVVGEGSCPHPDRVCVTTLFSRLQTHLLPDGRVRDARAGGEVGKPTPSMNSRSHGVKVLTESPGEVLSSLWRRERVTVH